MSLDIGKLDKFVRFEVNAPSKDSNGDTVDNWTTYCECWAAIEPLSVNALIAAQAIQSRVNARITVRYRPGLLASMRIIHRNNVYNIAGLLPDKDSGQEYLTIPVETGVNPG